MQLSNRIWLRYITSLTGICKEAGDLVQKWVDTNGLSDTTSLINYAYSVIDKYGSASGELACLMYDQTAELEGMLVAPAVAAVTPSLEDVGKAINGCLKQSPSGQLLHSIIGRQVKQVAADTTLNNGRRDRAQFAWIPSGDTCAFCITLASRGWQNIKSTTHADHIHSNCNCNYAIRFNKSTSYAGYDPDKYYKQYSNAGSVKALRNQMDSENRGAINEQKRNAYAKRIEFKKSQES